MYGSKFFCRTSPSIWSSYEDWLSQFNIEYEAGLTEVNNSGKILNSLYCPLSFRHHSRRTRNAKGYVCHSRSLSCDSRCGNSRWIVLQPATIPNEFNSSPSSGGRELLGQSCIPAWRDPHAGAEHCFRS